jgi:hypothetical protein
MSVDDSNKTNLVSNVIVSDIRDDINKAMTMCTFTDRGIEYKTMAKPVDLSTVINITKNAIENANPNNNSTTNNYYGEKIIGNVYAVKNNLSDTNVLYYARCVFDGNSYKFIKVNTTPITHFDLVLYPFTPVYGLNSKQEFINSFKYTDLNLAEIKQNLEENKTLAHNFISPEDYEIVSIKNYYGLTAKVTTNRKVSTIEQADILGKIYSKIYENFNLRRLEFSEEIPYDTILKVMESTDARIKYVKLEDPIITTKICLASGAEYNITNSSDIQSDNTAVNPGNMYYNQLALNNVIAGRIPLFKYDESFKPDFTEQGYPY